LGVLISDNSSWEEEEMAATVTVYSVVAYDSLSVIIILIMIVIMIMLVSISP